MRERYVGIVSKETSETFMIIEPRRSGRVPVYYSFLFGEYELKPPIFFVLLAPPTYELISLSTGSNERIFPEDLPLEVSSFLLVYPASSS